MADPGPAGPSLESGAMEQRVGATFGDPPALRCCCGRDDCVFLKHNCTVLEGVEQDVHNAARMGQALLDRHEAYMASAERDRSELTARIEELEMANSELEAANKRAADENQNLQDQLELLNTEAKDADTKASSLEATLRETQMEVRRLEAATARATALERHIIMLEEEQASLHNTLSLSEEEARTAMHRWKQAERAILNLQDQLEKIEQEAQQERDRHYEVMDRMEKQRTVEKDLNAAAGRLKGAAATKSLYNGKGGSVVSHFVRDLLQDNANLQIGIAELRELLMNSNDEIQMLRDQLQHHQPLAEGEVSAASTLRAELEPKEPQVHNVSQELHIHHHYHVANTPEPKKARKKRQGLTPGTFTPPHGLSSPSTPARLRLNRASPAPAMVSHRHNDSLASGSSMPSNPRWSMLSDNPSEFLPSSAPSSPPTSNRNSMFDRGMVDMSFPTSPTTSVDPLSPSWKFPHRKKNSEVSAASISTMAGFPLASEDPQRSEHGRPPAAAEGASAMAAHHPLANSVADCVPEEIPELTAGATTDDSTVDTVSSDGDELHPMRASQPSYHGHFDPTREQRPTLRRVVSHESIMSLSGGLEIHTLKARPSQLTLRQLGATSAVANLSAVTARPMMASGAPGSGVLKDNLVGLGLPIPKTRERVVSGSIEHLSITPRQSSGALGRLVSWRPWGSSSPSQPQHSPSQSPAATPILPSTPASPALQPPATPSSTSSTPTQMRSPTGSHHRAASIGAGKALKDKDLSRASGINQPGAIPGFYEYWAAHQRRGPSSKVLPDSVDQDALREVLDEG